MKSTYLPILLSAFLFLGIHEKVFAQPAMGVSWNQPDNTNQIQNDLALFERYGITYIEVSHPVGDSILQQIEESPFNLLVRLEPAFLTLSNIENNTQALLKRYSSIADEYRTYRNITGIGLLSNSQTMHPDFENVFTPLLDSLNSSSNKSFYFYTSNSWSYFNNPGTYFGVHFDDSEYQQSDITSFNQFFESKLSNSASSVVFINSNWLKEAINSYPELSESLIAYNQTQQWKLPLPDSEASASFPNWLVFILLILWIGFSVQLRYLSYVRPMIVRYFLAHRFFVDDILHYRQRAALGGILTMGQHAVFSGLVAYMTAKTLISPTGLEAFFYHIPALAIAGSNYISFFVLGVIIVLITQAIALLWLHLPAKNIGHISQTINLYAGSFFVDFILVTVMLTLFINGFGPITLTTCAVIFVLVWYAAFNFTAVDISSGTGPGKITYLALTIGLHTLITIGIGLFLIYNTEFMQTLALSFSL